jgi:hypothetical protein
MNISKSIALLGSAILLCTAGTGHAQEDKPCTYSIRSNSSWNPQTLLGPDPDGELVGHSLRTSTGFCTYLVDVGAGKQLLKLYSPDSQTQTLGVLSRLPNSNGIAFTAEGSSPITGNFAVPLSKGVVILREGAAFIYEAGKAVATYTPPSGWSPHPLQNGDVLGTQMLLVVKTSDLKGAFGFGGTNAASLLRIPDNRVRYGLWDLLQNSVVLEFDSQGRSNNQFLMMSAGPKGDWPYKFNPLIRPNEGAGFISSPADWLVAGGQRIVVHYDKSLSEIWMRNLTTGKSRLAVKNPLGILSFYVPYRDGAYAFSSEGTRFFKDIVDAIDSQ